MIVARPTSTRHVRQVALGDHLCLPFTDDEEQREVLSTFIADGLSRGERVLYYSDQTDLGRIGGWLARRGVDPAGAIADGQLQIRPINTNYVFHGRFEPELVITTLCVEVRKAREAGYLGLRVSGEMTSQLRPVAELGHLVEFEHRLAAAFDSRELAAICQYDRRLFDPDSVRGMIDCHPQVVEIDPLHDDRRLRILRTFQPPGLRVLGVVDVTTAGALTATLDHTLATNPDRDLHLDLKGLQFIDVAGVRALVRAAECMPAGRRLVIEQLAPGLRRVFAIVGWDRTPGLLVAEEEVAPP